MLLTCAPINEIPPIINTMCKGLNPMNSTSRIAMCMCVFNALFYINNHKIFLKYLLKKGVINIGNGPYEFFFGVKNTEAWQSCLAGISVI